MSDVAQTTRNTIQGIYTDNEAQIIFMDTPGIHKPQDGLGNFMNTTALNSIYGVDMVLFIAPANETIGRGDRFIIERLKEADGPVFLLLNKCDLVSKEEVVKKLTEWKELFDFKEIIPISALEDQNVDTLISTIKNYLNEGMMYYPKDQMTDHPERFVMAEFIREKISYRGKRLPAIPTYPLPSGGKRRRVSSCHNRDILLSYTTERRNNLLSPTCFCRATCTGKRK